MTIDKLLEFIQILIDQFGEDATVIEVYNYIENKKFRAGN